MQCERSGKCSVCLVLPSPFNLETRETATSNLYALVRVDAFLSDVYGTKVPKRNLNVQLNLGNKFA